jgi:hypothetical protein
MLNWDRVTYEAQRRQDERAFAAQQRLIRRARRHASLPAKGRRRRLACRGARSISRGGRVQSLPLTSG